MIIHRLTVDGRDYFLPSPIDTLKASILEAIKAGGGYVTVPPLRGGPGLDILFSPGMPVVWAQIEVAEAEPETLTSNVDTGFDAEGL
ncbi:hypothetical protein GCM10007382_17400 [Salinibacterium xinjiangense]|uniref:Uncharacterized protein n=1 Tax=Salinibacterium xinjiangense TaxID=386302 RepID=A0A2C8YKS6_9MICO|nr:hypothetical protein [Salinibacterium xinjiangense]GGK97651.1 hypothetical protein GCM10007382_17400 [Salinibacterium xinjiangense]SOE51057.1 hypothetical protein SAMN06296378_0396 [Salinibacterium xinjiangense]